MGTTVVLAERRRDGKIHPQGGRLSERDHSRAVTLVHALRCRDHMSFRKIVYALESYGLRVSLGSVHGYATEYECDRCAEPAPDQQERAERHQDTR